MKNSIKFPITELGLELTQKCNLACSYCYLGDRSQCYLDMNEDVADGAINLLFQNAVNGSKVAIDFWGGEPLLNFKMLKYITEKSNKLAAEKSIKINYLVITNGTIINEEMLHFFDKENIQLQISLDGDETTHDFYRKTKRGKGSYQKILSNIQKINDYNCSGRNCTYSIKSTITKQAVPVNKILDHFNAEGFSYSLTPATSAPFFDEHGIIEPHEMEQQAKILLDDWEQQFNEGRIVKNNLIMSYLKKICFNEKQKYACTAGLSYFGISADGKVYPCHRMFNNPDSAIGDVWYGIDLEMTNSLFNHTIDERESCAKCPMLFTCGSTCPVESIGNGGFNNIDPVYCAFNKTIIKECIQFLIKIKKVNPNKYQELINMLNTNNTDKEIKIVDFPFMEINRVPVLPQDFGNVIPQKAENAKVIDLDEDGIIYIEGDIDRKYIGNITTMAIWDLIDGRRKAEDIAGIIADLCKVGQEEISEDIYKQIAVFNELGFINVK